jgi:anti-sigma factor (TIGR02949 family)
MSCGGPHEVPCQEVLHSLVLFIDHEIEDQQQVHQIEVHFQECPPCQEELTHEQTVMAKLKQLLSGSCNEAAPSGLEEKIHAQTAALAQQMQAQFFGMPTPLATPFSTQVTTQYSRHEFIADGVETRIEIETTEITHHFEVEEE